MTRSPRRAAAAVVLIAIAGAAHAQSVQLQGVLDMSLGRFQSAGAPRTVRVESSGLSPSWIGLRGDDDLGGGIKAVFALEHDIRVDTGQAGRFTGDAFWSREASIGLAGAFGTSRLGRNPTPLYVAAVRFNPFGESIAFAPSLRQLFAPSLAPFFGDSRWDNSVSYASPDYDGISWSFAGGLGEGLPGATGKNIGGSVLYTRGPLAATAAYQKVRNGLGLTSPSPAFGSPAAFLQQETWHAGVAYEMGVARLTGQYSHVHTEAAVGATTKIWNVGVAVPLGAGRLLAEYGTARASLPGADPRQRMLSVGYDHSLSPRTDVYAVFVNDDVSGLATGRTLAGGLRMRF